MEANLKWLDVKLDYVCKASMSALGHHHLCVKIYADIIKALGPQWLIAPSHVYLVLEQLLDPLTEWPHKVLPQQTEVRVKVEMRVCVALRGEVGSKEGPVVLLELFRSWVDGYGPEILLLFFNWVGSNEQFILIQFIQNIQMTTLETVHCWLEARNQKSLPGLSPPVGRRA